MLESCWLAEAEQQGWDELNGMHVGGCEGARNLRRAGFDGGGCLVRRLGCAVPVRIESCARVLQASRFATEDAPVLSFDAEDAYLSGEGIFGPVGHLREQSTRLITIRLGSDNTDCEYARGPVSAIGRPMRTDSGHRETDGPSG